MLRSTALTAIIIILLTSVARVSGAEVGSIYWPAAAIAAQAHGTFAEPHVVTRILQWQVSETI